MTKTVSATWSEPNHATLSFVNGNKWTHMLHPTNPPPPRPGMMDDHVGVFLDPRHWTSASLFAGLRAISESPPHVLKIVGSDDGLSFWSVRGACSGSEMRNITVDFSAKGGPVDLQGIWQTPADAPGQIVWADGNTWRKMSYTHCADCPWAVGAPSSVEHSDHKKEEEHRKWWEPVYAHYHSPLWSWKEHIAVIVIFSVPAAGVVYYLYKHPEIRRIFLL